MDLMIQVVKCPVSAKRLMDMLSAKEANLQIKGPKCKKVINVLLINNQVHGEAV
jgi:phage FluMu protein Com